jgi:hypothetical protein
MASFECNDTLQQANGPTSSFAAAVPPNKRRVWVHIGVVSVASFVIGTLCGVYALSFRNTEADLYADDELSQELSLGIDTLVEWFPEKNADVKGKKKDIVFHMTNFTEDSDPEVKNLAIDTIEKDDESIMVVDRRLQTLDKCKEAVIDFMFAFAGWLKSFVSFAAPQDYELRKNMTVWINKNIVGPTAFQKLIAKMVDFAYQESIPKRLKVLWSIIKDAFIKGGGWIKNLLKMAGDLVAEGKWPKTKTLVKLAAQIATWIKKGPVEFVGAATLQYLATESMIKNAKKLSKCQNHTIFKAPKTEPAKLL